MWNNQNIPCIHTYLLLLISMLWHRQAIFKSKGDKLCSFAKCRIWTRDLRHQIASRLNARWQTDWAIEDQAKILNSTARPYHQRAFSPLGPTVSWLSHLALAIYIFFVVNFDALAQASDIQIERRQVVFLCWMQDLNPGSQTPNRQQTKCSLTNRLSYRGSSLKLELDSPSLWSASIQPTWPHCQLTFAPGSGYYLPTYLPTFLPTYLHTYIHTYIHTHIHTYIHTCVFVYVYMSTAVRITFTWWRHGTRTLPEFPTHRSPVGYRHNGPLIQSVVYFFICC